MGANARVTGLLLAQVVYAYDRGRGDTLESIAADAGCSPGAVRNALIGAGIPLAPTGTTPALTTYVVTWVNTARGVKMRRAFSNPVSASIFYLQRSAVDASAELSEPARATLVKLLETNLRRIGQS